MSDFSPAADRNKAPILAELDRLLPARASVLEIASGSGQHAAHFAAAHPGWTWQPTEAAAASLPTIVARTAGLANVRPPLLLDVLMQPWPTGLGRHDAIYCANLLHIAPWATCRGLMDGAVRHLVSGGLLILYGPYVVDGEPMAPGNLAFDADLRRRDPAWGLRALAPVTASAREAGLVPALRIAMPANNLLLTFAARGRTAGPADDSGS